jgi:hypothetical protein
VGDTTDTALLEQLIYERLQAKTLEQAKEILEADLDELDAFLSEPKRRNDRLHFVLGFLLIAAEDPAELLKPPKKPELSNERLVMDLPPKAKSKVSEEWPCLTVEWQQQRFYAQKCGMGDDIQAKKVLVEFAHPNASAYELFILRGEPALAEMVPPAAREIRRQSVSVNLGQVNGHKYISTGEPPAVWKRVDYLLQIPGAYVRVSIQARVLFDDSKWEPYLTTLRLEKIDTIGAKA